MLINKDTKIYCSFSSKPGNNGCNFFNSKFAEKKINAIYKSFYSNNIEDSVSAVKVLDIKGFAVSMPFKIEILKLVNNITPEAKIIGAANTITNSDNILTAYNTDWMGVYKFLSNITITNNFITILGTGGFSKAVQYAFKKLNINYNIIKRNEWKLVPTIKNTIFNCTPVEVKSKYHLIDGRPFTMQGKQIANFIAQEQLKIYLNE